MHEFIDGAYVNAAGIRNYKLYVAGSRPGDAPPLFVMLHGCDQDAADFAVGTRMNELAEECRGVVLYPEQCRLVNPFGCWNWHDANHQSADHGEPSLIAGMTRQEVVVEHNIDPARVYVAGMSAGGAMAVILGQEYPDLYAAVGVHSDQIAHARCTLRKGRTVALSPARRKQGTVCPKPNSGWCMGQATPGPAAARRGRIRIQAVPTPLGK